MTRWNDALDAYDEDCEAIEQVREEYGSYLRSVFDAVSAAVSKRLGEEWRGKFDAATGPALGWYATPRKVGIYAWNARAFGGPRRTLVAGILLDVRSGFSPREGALRRRLFFEAAARSEALAPLRPEKEKHGDVHGDIVGVLGAEVGPNTTAELVEQALILADLAATLDKLVERCDWLAQAIQPLVAKKPPVEAKGVSWQGQTLKRFAAGFYIQLDAAAEAHTIWVLARPPGQLILGHHGSRRVDEALRKTLKTKPFTLEGDEDGFTSVLLELDDVAKLYDRQDVESVQRRAVEAFAAYFRVAK